MCFGFPLEGWPAVSQHNVHIEAAGQSILETYGNNICVVTGHLVTHTVERLSVPAPGLVPGDKPVLDSPREIN